MSILMMIMIAVQVIALALSPAARDAARDFLAGSSEREFRDALGPSAAMSVVTGLLVIALAVLTMIWMFRMAKNLQTVQRVATWTPGWAIGGWFLPPGVLYVIPYLMLRDLWRGSSPEHNDWRDNTISPLVHAWWVFYGLLPIAFVTITLSGTSIRGTNLRKVARNLDDQFARSIAAGIVQIAAAMVYLALVRQLTQRHARFTHETP